LNNYFIGGEIYEMEVVPGGSIIIVINFHQLHH
jgi:hypothetical protein